MLRGQLQRIVNLSKIELAAVNIELEEVAFSWLLMTGRLIGSMRGAFAKSYIDYT